MRRENAGRQEGLLWITLGLLLMAAALFLASYNLYDARRAGQSVSQAAVRLEAAMPSQAPAETEAAQPGDPTPLVGGSGSAIPDYVRWPNMEMPVETVEGIDFIGILELPSLDLTLPIISQWSYPDLKVAPCRYSGSAYLDNLILCGHNYAAHFGTLKDLNEGDPAVFTDMDGNTFSYRMVERETLKATDLEAMEAGDWDLTLFTCTVGGQTRVTLRFEREED